MFVASDRSIRRKQDWKKREKDLGVYGVDVLECFGQGTQLKGEERTCSCCGYKSSANLHVKVQKKVKSNTSNPTKSFCSRRSPKKSSDSCVARSLGGAAAATEELPVEELNFV